MIGIKDFIISIILFSILVAVIIGNSLYIIKEVNILRDTVTSIPSIDSPDCQYFINSLRDRWHSFKKVARLSLNYAEINKMDCLIEEMDCHLSTQNNNDFEHTRVMILNLLGEIARLERLSIDGLF